MVNISILITLILIFLTLVKIKNSLHKNDKPKEETYSSFENYSKDIYEEMKKFREELIVLREIKNQLDKTNSLTSKIEGHAALIKSSIDQLDNGLIRGINSIDTDVAVISKILFEINYRSKESNGYLASISNK